MQASEAPAEKLLFVVLPGPYAAGAVDTVEAILRQDIGDWSCLVLQHSFVDEAEEALSDTDDRVRVVTIDGDVPTTLNRALRDHDAAVLAVLTPGDLPLRSFARGRLQAHGETRSTAEGAGPEAIVAGLPVDWRSRERAGEGLHGIEEFLEHPPASSAVTLAVAAVMAAGGFSSAFPHLVVEELCVRLLTPTGRWRQLDAEDVVVGADSSSLGTAMAYAREAVLLRSAVLGASAQRTDLFAVEGAPTHAERVEAKRLLWTRLRRPDARARVRDVWRHREYFTAAGLATAVLVAVCPRPLRSRAVARLSDRLG